MTTVLEEPLQQTADGVVRPLAALRADELDRFGNKAAQLARLAHAGLPVPDGFCIAGDAIPNDWSADTPPSAMALKIAEAYRQLGAPLVAVRSSADDEDLAERSGAGLYRSLLGVRGEAALLRAVIDCWRARLAPRAQCCRKIATPTRMAILVQIQVPAEASGVMFTADPLDDTSDRIIINAIWGLGEPLASGRMCGDVFHATPHGVLARQILSCKATMLTASGERNVPHWRRHAPSLNAQQVRRLVGLAHRVRETCPLPAGQALDIEFAFEHGQPKLLQARPVPVLRVRPDPIASYLEAERRRLAARIARWRTHGQVRGSEFILSAGNIGELLPTPTPFSFGLFRHIFDGPDGAIKRGRRRLGYQLDACAGAPLFLEFGGQAYFNLEADAATYATGISLPIEAILEAVARDPGLANYPELDLYPRLMAETPEGANAARLFRTSMLRHGARLSRLLPRILPLLSVAPSPSPASFSTLDFAALQNLIAARLKYLRAIGLRFVMAARLGFFFADTLRRGLRNLQPERAESLYASLLQGLPGSQITEQGLDLERLAQGILSDAAFLARYGHMSSNELELLHPRLVEMPERLQRQVVDLRTSRRSPSRDFARQTRRRRRTEAALAHVFAEHAALPSLREDLAMAQFFLPLRETLKFHLAAHYAALRLLLQVLAGRLGCTAETLLHLTPGEVVALTPLGGDIWRIKADQRKKRRELAQRLARRRSLPRVIFESQIDTIDAGSMEAAAPASAAAPGATCLEARPIAPGIAEGIVHHLALEDEALDLNPPKLGGDEILVTTSANLGLAPLFRTAAGVIVEVGGVLAHCACQAREAGIPALVLADATRLLRHGDRVRIDAGRGLVTILERTEHTGDRS